MKDMEPDLPVRYRGAENLKVRYRGADNLKVIYRDADNPGSDTRAPIIYRSDTGASII
jgi:hypothetical protein